MKRVFVITVILIQALLYQACDNSNKNKKLEKEAVLVNESDVDENGANFIKQASRNGLLAIEFSKIAQQQASSPEVRQFAQKMAAEHTRFYNELKKMATEKYILLPIKMEQDDVAKLNELRKLKGTAFDEAYMRAIISSHEGAVQNFETGARNRDREVNKFATGKLDSIKTNFNAAKSVFNNLVINRD